MAEKRKEQGWRSYNPTPKTVSTSSDGPSKEPNGSSSERSRSRRRRKPPKRRTVSSSTTRQLIVTNLPLRKHSRIRANRLARFRRRRNRPLHRSRRPSRPPRPHLAQRPAIRLARAESHDVPAAAQHAHRRSHAHRRRPILQPLRPPTTLPPTTAPTTTTTIRHAPTTPSPILPRNPNPPTPHRHGPRPQPSPPTPQ